MNIDIFENNASDEQGDPTADMSTYDLPPDIEGHNVAIVGSKDFDDLPRLVATVEAFAEKYGLALVVSGGASGADSIGEAWAMTNEVPAHIHLARWNEGDLSRSGRFGAYNPRAGINRNEAIVRDADIVLAFCSDWSKSRGTQNTIDRANKAKKPVFVWDGAQRRYSLNKQAKAFKAENE